MTTRPQEVDIARLGAQGDGIAETADGPRYVPFALPGECVRDGGQGLPELLSAPSPERREPSCRHFATCGGCVAQHMSEPLYESWKRGIVVEALRQRSPGRANGTKLGPSAVSAIPSPCAPSLVISTS